MINVVKRVDVLFIVHSITRRPIKSTAQRVTRFTTTRTPRSDGGKARAAFTPRHRIRECFYCWCCFKWRYSVHSYPIPSPTFREILSENTNVSASTNIIQTRQRLLSIRNATLSDCRNCQRALHSCRPDVQLIQQVIRCTHENTDEEATHEKDVTWNSYRILQMYKFIPSAYSSKPFVSRVLFFDYTLTAALYEHYSPL